MYQYISSLALALTSVKYLEIFFSLYKLSLQHNNIIISDPMDSIKAQKLQAMKNYKKAQFVYNLVVYSLTAFLSTLFYLYFFCFPSMREFLFDFLPNIYSFLLNPKFLFMLGNIIVIILVGESKLAAGSRSSPATEIYDEYVERSRSLRRQSVVECKKKNGNPEMVKNEKSRIRKHCSLNNIRCLEVKKNEMSGRSLRRPRSVVEHGKDGTLEVHDNEKTNVANRDDDLYNTRSVEEKRKETVGQSLTRPLSLGRLDMHYENEKTTMATRGDDICNTRCLEAKKKAKAGQGLTRPMSLGILHMRCENEKTTTATGGDDLYNTKFPEEERKEIVTQSLTRPQSLGRLDIHENEKSSDADVNKMSLEERREEMEQSKDDLNRRVEEFIARVNRQRMLEALELDSSPD